MNGQLKVSGNIMAAQKLQQIYSENLLKSGAAQDKETAKVTAKATENQGDEEDKALLEVHRKH